MKLMSDQLSCRGTLHLHSRSFLSAAARKSLARNRRNRRLGRPLPRLERAHHRGMLCAQRRLAHRQRREPDHPHHEQLFAHQLQLRAHPAFLAGRECASHLSHDPRCRSAKHAALRRSWIGTGPGLQPRHHAPGQYARPDYPDPLGHRRLPASLRPRARRHVAFGNRGGYRNPGPAGAKWHPLHHSCAAPVRPGSRARGNHRCNPFSTDWTAPSLAGSRLPMPPSIPTIPTWCN